MNKQKTLMLAVVFALAATVTAAAQCQCDDVALQRHVEKYNELARRCERAAWEEKDYLMHLWHWKACMWDLDAPRFGRSSTDQGGGKRPGGGTALALDRLFELERCLPPGGQERTNGAVT